MNNVDDVVRGLKCCRNWESLRGILPECADCPFADEDEGTCEDMKQQINAAINLIEAQKEHIEEVHKWIRELAKAVKWDERHENDAKH